MQQQKAKKWCRKIQCHLPDHWMIEMEKIGEELSLSRAAIFKSFVGTRLKECQQIKHQTGRYSLSR